MNSQDSVFFSLDLFLLHSIILFYVIFLIRFIRVNHIDAARSSANLSNSY